MRRPSRRGASFSGGCVGSVPGRRPAANPGTGGCQAGDALIAASFGLGSVAGGIAEITIRVARILLVAGAAVLALVVPMILLAARAGTAAVAAAGFVAGFRLSVAGVLYETAAQQHVPTEAPARVSALEPSIGPGD